VQAARVTPRQLPENFRGVAVFSEKFSIARKCPWNAGFCDIALQDGFARVHLAQRAERRPRTLDAARRAEFAAGKKILRRTPLRAFQWAHGGAKRANHPERFAPACLRTACSATPCGTSPHRRAQNFRSHFGLFGVYAALFVRT